MHLNDETILLVKIYFQKNYNFSFRKHFYSFINV